jgi:hypothetical protein
LASDFCHSTGKSGIEADKAFIFRVNNLIFRSPEFTIAIHFYLLDNHWGFGVYKKRRKK